MVSPHLTDHRTKGSWCELIILPQEDRYTNQGIAQYTADVVKAID